MSRIILWFVLIGGVIVGLYLYFGYDLIHWTLMGLCLFVIVGVILQFLGIIPPNDDNRT